MRRRTSGFARQSDANHSEILNAFRQLGCSVQDTRLVGGGFGDAVVGYLGRDRQVEVKQPGKRPTANQEAFYKAWKGATPLVIHSVDEAAQAVRMWLD